ncbi:hypothetical protein NDU88_007609 [Pleurodeles waltl]|uniref:Uncharacterized protein n=1 Tax=Pleurodeles waltl TaxID=8319 RepID=A0AAV7U090_PLEWA|nr:hypothetical protein NDU88_007609 [Pleurodeles waltl]
MSPAGPLYESPWGTLENLFDASTTGPTYVMRNPHKGRKCGRSEESISMEMGKRKDEDSGQEGEPESQDPATGNEESGDASHVQEGTWLFQVRDLLHSQLSELIQKVGWDREEGLGTKGHSTQGD